MAKQTYADAVVPQRSQGYGAILGLTLLAMLGGITLICLELREYDWQSEAKTTPAQKVTPIPAPEAAPAPAPK
jgi:hypothetical protein